jgi:hypothetical protein
MGGTIKPGHAHLMASITHASGQECLWMRNGVELKREHIAGDRAALSVEGDFAAAEWVSILIRDHRHVTGWSNPIYVAISGCHDGSAVVHTSLARRVIACG